MRDGAGAEGTRERRALGAGADEPVFVYEVEPTSVRCSGPDPGSAADGPRRHGEPAPGAGYSTVSLTVHVINPTAAAVSCPLVVLGMVLGEGEGALTADPSTVRSAPGRVTPWHIGGGDGRWGCMPLPPTTGLAPQQRASFELAGVVVNRIPGATYLSVRENTGGVERTTLLKLTKLPAQGKPPAVPAGRSAT